MKNASEMFDRILAAVKEMEVIKARYNAALEMFNASIIEGRDEVIEKAREECIMRHEAILDFAIRNAKIAFAMSKK